MTNINEIQTKHLHSIFKVTYLKYIWNCTLKENSEISTISIFRRFHFLIFLTPLARSFRRNIPKLWFYTFNIFIFIFCWFLVTFQILEKNYQTFHPRKDLKTTIACFCCIRTIVTKFQLLRVYKKENIWDRGWAASEIGRGIESLRARTGREAMQSKTSECFQRWVIRRFQLI